MLVFKSRNAAIICANVDEVFSNFSNVMHALCLPIYVCDSLVADVARMVFRPSESSILEVSILQKDMRIQNTWTQNTRGKFLFFFSLTIAIKTKYFIVNEVSMNRLGMPCHLKKNLSLA